jgi:hypothetical protein
MMTVLSETLSDFADRFGGRLALPEYRQIELYSKKKKLHYLDEAAAPPVTGTLRSLLAYTLLEAHLESRDLALEGKNGWDKYLALPRQTTTEKLVAEVFRILRVLRTVFISPVGHLTIEHGLIKCSVTHNRCSLAVTLSRHGLTLLESVVVYYLESFRQPYSEAYVETMLMQYYTDIVGEINKFSDEDRVLYQFRQKITINRQLRLDCDSPKYKVYGEKIILEVGELYRDAARYPIDFFFTRDDLLYIVPAEALRGMAMDLSELGRWRARTGQALPAEFRERFGREPNVVGQPMT